MTRYLNPYNKGIIDAPENYPGEEPDYLEDFELDGMYAEMLDDAYGDVMVAGYEYATSGLLREIDPIAYRVGFSDWLDSMLTDEALFEVES